MSKLIKEKKKFRVKGLLGNDSIIVIDRIKDKYGFIPKSVWDITRDFELSKLVNPKYLEAQSKGKDFTKRAESHREKHRKKEIPIPEFLPDMVKRCLQIYTKEGDKVLDPFCHSGIVPLLAAYYGRFGVGFDIVPEYIEYCKNRKEQLIYDGYGKWASCMKFEVVNSIEMDILKYFNEPMFDYILTSPPYYNTRKYKDTKGQLASIGSYRYFLLELALSINKLYKILKPNKFISFVVSDFRINGEYIPFNRDISNIAEEVGLKPHDTIIHVLRTPFLIGMQKALENEKRMIKYHEYILTFKKD